jgi:hypothetical protein
MFLMIISYIPFHMYEKVSHYHNMDSLSNPFHVLFAYADIMKSSTDNERTEVIIGGTEAICKGDFKYKGPPICE